MKNKSLKVFKEIDKNGTPRQKIISSINKKRDELVNLYILLHEKENSSIFSQKSFFIQHIARCKTMYLNIHITTVIKHIYFQSLLGI